MYLKRFFPCTARCLKLNLFDFHWRFGINLSTLTNFGHAASLEHRHRNGNIALGPESVYESPKVHVPDAESKAKIRRELMQSMIQKIEKLNILSNEELIEFCIVSISEMDHTDQYEGVRRLIELAETTSIHLIPECMIKWYDSLLKYYCRGAMAFLAETQLATNIEYRKQFNLSPTPVAIYESLLNLAKVNKSLDYTTRIIKNWKREYGGIIDDNISRLYETTIRALFIFKGDYAMKEYEEAKSILKNQINLHSTVFECLCKANLVEMAVQIFSGLNHQDIRIEYALMIQTALARLGNYFLSEKFFNDISSRYNLTPNVDVWNSRIECFAKLDEMNRSMAIYNEMINSGIIPNLRTFEIVIYRHFKSCDTVSIMSLFEDMQKFDILPNSKVSGWIVESLMKSKKWDSLKDFIEYIRNNNIKLPRKLKNVFVNRYKNCENMELYHEYFRGDKGDDLNESSCIDSPYDKGISYPLSGDANGIKFCKDVNTEKHKNSMFGVSNNLKILSNSAKYTHVFEAVGWNETLITNRRKEWKLVEDLFSIPKEATIKKRNDIRKTETFIKDAEKEYYDAIKKGEVLEKKRSIIRKMSRSKNKKPYVLMLEKLENKNEPISKAKPKFEPKFFFR